MQTGVDRKRAPDYHTFVAPEDEMNLAKIGRKISGARYTSAQGLLADFRQIHSNACAYNAPGCGRYGGPSEPLNFCRLGSAECSVIDPVLHRRPSSRSKKNHRFTKGTFAQGCWPISAISTAVPAP